MSTKAAGTTTLRGGGQIVRTELARRVAAIGRMVLLPLLGLVLGLGFSSTALALQINRISSTNLFVDLGNLAECNFAQYQITNNDAVAYTNLWVTIGGFSGSIVKLGGGDPGQVNVGKLGINEAKNIYFYLDGSSLTTSNQTHTVSVYRGFPATGTLLTNASFALQVVDMPQNNANKLNSMAVTPGQPIVGASVIITVDGKIGTLKAGDPIDFFPATFTNWAAYAFELIGLNVIITNGASTFSLSNQVSAATPVQLNGATAGGYRAQYFLRAIAPTVGATPISPDGCFGTGSNSRLEHSTLASGLVIPQINAPTNATVLAKLASVSQLYTNETVTYTLRFTNSSTNDVTLDRVVDTLPSGLSYVPNSSTFNGVPTAPPTVSGQVFTWSETYAVPGLTSRDFVFTATGTNAGFNTNSAIAFVKSTQIDTTLVTTDNVPATVTVRVLLEPRATNDTGILNEDTTLNVTAPGVLANDNEPNGFSITVVSYAQPAHGTVTVNPNGSYLYTPAANYNGADSFTYTLTNGNARASTATVNLTITAVNDPPTLDAIGNLGVNENVGQQTVNLTGISPGPANETGQSLTVTATSSNPSLIPDPGVTYTSPNATGTLSFTPAANQFGASTITVVVRDNGGTANGGIDSVTNTFLVAVGPVNLPPTLDPIANLSINEDSGLQTVNLTGISAGPPNESSQTLTITAISSAPTIVPNPTVNFISPSARTLTFTPVLNAFGTSVVTVIVHDNGGTANGGVDSVTNTFTVTVNPVNDPPTLNPLGNLIINENAGQQTVNLSGISPGPANEAGQNLTVTATSSNPSLIPNPAVTYSSPNATGSLTFTPVANQFGASTITVVVRDDGGTANGGIDAVTNTFTVTVNPVNHAPTLDQISDLVTNEDSGPQTIDLTGIGPGDPSESSQTLTITATSSDLSIIANPTIDYTNSDTTGTLTFTPVLNAFGTSVVTVIVHDNGGIANGGVDSVTNTFTVVLNPVNDPPTLDPIANFGINENAGQQTVNLGGISPGPANEAGQNLTVTAISSNPSLIPNPVVNYTSPNVTGTLTFTPAANQFGSSTITVIVQDDGGTANGGVDSVTNTFIVAVGPVNLPPTLDPINDLVISEDSGLQTVNLSGITAGRPSESGQSLTITAISSDPSIIPNPTVNYTSPNASGTLTFTPPPNTFGASTITVIVQDNGGTANGGVDSVTNTFVVTVNPVNDPPTLNAISNLTINENAGQQTVNLSGISSGPANEGSQHLTVIATSSNPSLIPNPAVTYISPNATGSLTFTPVANQFGSSTITVVVLDDGGTANGGINAVTNTFTVTVNAVNQPPTVDPISDVVTNEDSGPQTINLTGISAGPPSESGQTVTITAISSDLSVLPDPGISYTNSDTTGTLTFTPVLNAFGTSIVTVIVHDNGGTGNGGIDSVTNTFTIVINPVNDPPTLDAIGNVVINENAGQQTVNLTGISSGPANEAGQNLTVTAVSSNPSLIPNPVVTYTSPGATGTLKFTPVANRFGSSTISVIVQDDGGIAHGGIDSVTKTFTVTVNPVNQPPTLDPVNEVVTNEDSGPQTIDLTGITPGPPSESSQTLTITATSSDTSILPDPTIAYTNSSTTGTLTFTPVPDAFGTSVVTVIVHDNGGTANGGVDSFTNTFTITLNPVNDPPTLDPIGNLGINENAGQQTVNLTGISAGPINEVGQHLTVTAISSNPSLIPNPAVTYTNPNAAGTLTFTPTANEFGVSTITVIVQDDGGTANGGVDSVTNTFTVAVGPVNLPPTLNPISDLDINEDSGLQTVNLTGITVGPPSEVGQSLTITVVSSDPSIVPNPTVNYTSPNAGGTLTFTPVLNAFGVSTITVIVQDSGGTANGGVDSVTNTFSVTVNPVNDPPTLDPINDVTLSEGAGLQTVNLSGISAGPANEAGQSITITAVSSNPSLFSNPAVTYSSPDSTGSLTFTPSAHVLGTSIVSVIVHDSGGTLNGGIDSVTNRFTVVVLGVTNIWEPNGNFIVKVSDASGSPGIGFTKTNYIGILDVQATSTNPFTITLVSLNGTVPGAAANFDRDANYSWMIATTGRGVTGFSEDKFLVDTTQFTNDLGGGGFVVTLSPDGTSVNLLFTNNHPPIASLATYGRAWGTALRISVDGLLVNFTSDPDGDGRALETLGLSTNGSPVFTNSAFILFAPTNNFEESFAYVIRDLHTYRPGDSIRTATNYVTVSVTNAVSSAQGIDASGGQGVQVRFAGVPGYAYDIERADNPGGPWVVLQTTNAPAGGVWLFQDPTPPQPTAFYRTRQH